MRTLLFLLLSASCALAQSGLRSPLWVSQLHPAAGAGGPATAADTFNRDDADPLSNPMSDGVSTWTPGAGALLNARIVSSVAQGQGDWAGARINTPAFAANQKMTGTVVSGALSGMGVCVRMQSASDASCYMLYADTSSQLTVYKCTDTGTLAFAGIGAAITQTLTAGDTIGLSAEGTSTVTLRVFFNGSEITTRTDSTSPYASGQPGFMLGASSVKLDSIDATDL